MGLRLDVGCGSKKKAGCIGIDYIQGPEVDFVLDVTRERWPFEDESVEYVYSSHTFEHLDSPNHVLEEIGRVCCDGATIEIWTPYAFGNHAFLYGHTTFLTEEIWLNFCYIYRDMHRELLKGQWLLKNINYVVLPQVQHELERHGFSLDFAIKYFRAVVFEFGVDIEFRKTDAAPLLPQMTYSHTRDGERFPLPPCDIHLYDPAQPQTFGYIVKKFSALYLVKKLWRRLLKRYSPPHS